MVYERPGKRSGEIESYWEFFSKYMLANFVLYATNFISQICFLKVPKLVIFREAALKSITAAIFIVIVQLAIVIVLMLSVKKQDYFDLPYAA